MIADGRDHFALIQFHFLGDAVQDALIGLMRHEPVDIIGRNSGFRIDGINRA